MSDKLDNEERQINLRTKSAGPAAQLTKGIAITTYLQRLFFRGCLESMDARSLRVYRSQDMVPVARRCVSSIK